MRASKILHVRSPPSAISVTSASAWFEAGQGCNTKGDFLQHTGPLRHSCTCGVPHRELTAGGRFATQVAPLFQIEFWSTVLEATCKALRDGVSIQKKSDQEYRDEVKAMLGYSSSPWFTRFSISLDSHTDFFAKFIASSFPAPAGLPSHLTSARPSSHSVPSVEGSTHVVSSSTASPAKGDLGIYGESTSIACGVEDGSGATSPVGCVGEVRFVAGGNGPECGCEVAAEGSRVGLVAGEEDQSGEWDHGAPRKTDHHLRVFMLSVELLSSLVHGKGRSSELGSRLSRFNGSTWISFSSQLTPHRVCSQPIAVKTDSPVEVSGQSGSSSCQDRLESETEAIQSGEQPDKGGNLPKVVPSRAWVERSKR